MPESLYEDFRRAGEMECVGVALARYAESLAPGGAFRWEKDPGAVRLGRKGGQAKVAKGFSTLSPEARRRIAMAGVKARKAKWPVS